MGPFSLSIWDEPGLLVDGFDRPPTVMMGHHLPSLCHGSSRRAAIRASATSTPTNSRSTSRFPTSSRRSSRRARRAARSRRGWSTRVEVCRGSRDHSRHSQRRVVGELGVRAADSARGRACRQVKLKPIVYNDLVRIAEVDGVPVAFLIALPDLNELTRRPRRAAVSVQLGEAACGACANRRLNASACRCSGSSSRFKGPGSHRSWRSR